MKYITRYNTQPTPPRAAACDETSLIEAMIYNASRANNKKIIINPIKLFELLIKILFFI